MTTDTDTSLDRDAYAACEYRLVGRFEANADLWEGHGHQFIADTKGWSSTDDAIAHAERGGFLVVVISINPSGRFEATLSIDGGMGVPLWLMGHGETRALAIRNALAAWWREQQKEKV